MLRKLRIGGLAARAQLPPKTIRYYEEVGLLPPAWRSRAGYRLYSSEDVERLNFVRRAKLLGLSLHQIKEIMGYVVDGQCGPLQQRLLALLETKCAEIDRQVQELLALKNDLHRLGADVSARLAASQGPAVGDGPCHCLTSSDEFSNGGTD